MFLRQFSLPATLLVTLALTFLLWQGSGAFAEHRVELPHHRLLLHVNTDDPEIMKHAIANAVNAARYYKEKQEAIDIEIVTNGAGVNMFREDKSPVLPLLEALRMEKHDVVFSVCGSTKAIMEANEGHSLVLVKGAQVVPIGIGRIIELEEKGWSYVKP
jgi:intracellular sulfur oxidation DsrE/DsrF family protein